MTVENAPLLSFNRGVVSPLALARVDIKRIAMSASTQENWMPRVLGPMSLRQGLGYVTNTNNNLPARYIPFLFSVSDTALIELTDSTMRVLVDDVPVTREYVASAVLNGTFNTALTSWVDGSDVGGTVTWVSASAVSFQGDGTNAALLSQTVGIFASDVGKRHALRIRVAQGDGIHLRVGVATNGYEYVSDATLNPGTHSISFIPTTPYFTITFYDRESYVSILNSCVVEGPGVVTLPTVWNTSDLDNVRFDQSADVQFLACVGKPPQRIERRGTYSWSVVEYTSEDGPFGVTNLTPTTLTPSALQGSCVITASKSIFSSSDIGRLVSITSVGQNVVASFSAANVFSGSVEVTGLKASRGIGIVIAGTFAGTITLQQSIGAVGAWTDVQSWNAPVSTSYNDALDNQIIFYRLGIKVGGYTSGTANISLTYSGGSLTGYARLTGTPDVGPLSPLTPATIATGSYPEGIVISPTGNSAYTACYNDNLICQYSRDVVTGNLTPLTPGNIATTGPEGITISPDGISLYVTNLSTNAVSLFGRDVSTGLLTFVSTTNTQGTGPLRIAISPNGKGVYVVGRWAGIEVYSRSLVTGVLTYVRTVNTPDALTFNDIVISSDGLGLYAASPDGYLAQFLRSEVPNPPILMYPSGTLYLNNPAGTPPAGIRYFSVGPSISALAMSLDGTSLYLTLFSQNAILLFRRNTGSLLVGVTYWNAYGTPSAVAVSPDGLSVYVTCRVSGSFIAQYARAPLTGLLTPLTPTTVATGTNAVGITLSPNGLSVYVVTEAGINGSIQQYSRTKSGTLMYASITKAFGAITASANWALGDWSAGVGYPSAVALYQQRLFFAGKGKVWGTVSGSFISNDPAQIGDAGPLNETIGSGMVDTINWLLAGSLFLIGAQGQEYVARSDALDAPLTPTTFNLKTVTSKGSSNVSPFRVDQSVFFVARNGSRVYEIVSDAYATAYNLYNAQDLTMLAPEICQPKIVRAAVQRNVDTRAHFVLSDGTAAVVVFDKAEDVKGWIKITTQGLIEDVVVIPAGPGVPEDKVYYVVNRGTTGALAHPSLTLLTPKTVAAGTSPQSLTISPDGLFVYVCNYSSNTVSQYSRSAAGLLTPLVPATVATGTNPGGIAISPDGLSAYITQAAAGAVSVVYQYSRSLSTGQLTPLTPASVSVAGNSITNVVVSSDGASVYATGTGYILEYSRAPSGLLTYLGEPLTGGANGGFAISPDGLSLYASLDSTVIRQYARDPATSLLTYVGNIQLGALGGGSGSIGSCDVAVSPLGDSVYALSGYSIVQFARDTSTGALTFLAETMTGTNSATGFGGRIVVSPDGTSVYLANQGNNTMSQYIRSISTGLLTAASPALANTGGTVVNPNANLNAVIVSPDKLSVYVTNPESTLISQFSRVKLDPVRFLEKFSLESETTGKPVAKLADAHTYYSGAAVTTLTGLSYLEGATVVCWGWNTIAPFTAANIDGTTSTVGRDFGTFVVVNGSITLPTAVTDACVGLGYQAKFRSTKLAYAAQQGTALNQKKKIPHLGLVLANTHAQGLQFGPDFTHLDNLPSSELGAPVDAQSVWTEYDFNAFEFNDTYTTDSRLCLVASAPRPATVLGAVVEVETHEKT